MIRAYDELAARVAGHLDLRTEATHQQALYDAFQGWDGIVVPRVVEELCGDRVIAMEYVPNAHPVDDEAVAPNLRARALRTGLRALYEMLFCLGLVHCDFHRGNLLVTSSGDLVLLDFGYVAKISARDRQLFGDLFLAIALNDAALASRVTIEAALNDAAPDGGLEDDIGELLNDVHALGPGEFQIGRFVMSMFDIQRRHGIEVTPSFTMPIMALLAYEGLLKSFAPSVDFQREAMPYILGARKDAGTMIELVSAETPSLAR